MSVTPAKVRHAFSEQGALASLIENYKPRDPQIEMAVAVGESIANKKLLVAEAGTGTGKTFAYLIPSLLSGKKIIVSTGTKNLQDQLFQSDLPRVKKALKSNAQVALLKGRSNYLCIHRLEQHYQELNQPPSVSRVKAKAQTGFGSDRRVLQDIVKVRKWSQSTISGDIGEVTELAQDSPVFPFVSSTVDNCLAKDCPHIESCYLVDARKKALEADIVVVNHHLFFADMALKDTGFGELIPSADAVVFDEAHQIPEIANEYFGQAFSTRQLLDLATDCLHEYHSELTDVKQLQKAADKLHKAALDFRLLFYTDPERGNWREKIQDHKIAAAFAALKSDLDFLYQVIKLCISRTQGIDNCFERALAILPLFDLMTKTDSFGTSLWYETTKRHVVMHQTPLSIREKFGEYIASSKAGWVFTSATLAVDGDFKHFTGELGIDQSRKLLVDSPFDYHQQSMLLVPRYLPATHVDNRAVALANLARPLIKASQGACFLLFTSYRVMNQVAALLEGQIDNPLLVQGKMAKASMLEQFIDHPQAVLLATNSFWEGVDVRGKKLTCVIIDKLPFVAPDEPLLQAKCDDVKRQGGDAFSQIQLPQAVITLKQGVGRLIRDVSDEGVMVICDDRLVNRHYGQVFLKSLPAMKRTREIEHAVSFLTALSDDNEEEN